jgi:ankyrin repeat protein
MTMSLNNRKIKSRIDSFSLEQALYFEPYQESEIKLELLQALRSNDLERLRSYHDTNSRNNKDAANSANTDSSDEDCNKLDGPLFAKRNEFGENLVHLACRMGMRRSLLRFLVDDVKVPLNVRDKFGRSPLHNACMAVLPNFDNLEFLLSRAPQLILFEDDSGKTPFEYVPKRCFESWTRFLSEQGILKQVANELEKRDTLLIA